MCSSPWLIAAYRGLHRLPVPRHPPHAFARLTTSSCSSRARAIYLIECSTYTTSRVGFVSHDHYRRTVVKQRMQCGRASPCALKKHPTLESSVLSIMGVREQSPLPPYPIPRERVLRIARKIEIEIGFVKGVDYVRTFRALRALTRRSVKEVIQPQVPLRLPCYDFAPVTTLAFGGLVPCGFRHRLRALVASMA